MESQSTEIELIQDPLQEAPKKGEENENEERKRDLPTNPEIIATGLAAYEAVYKSLPDHLKDFFLKEHAFKTLFLGFTPHINGAFVALSPEKLQELMNTIESHGQVIKPIITTQQNWRDGSEYKAVGFLNIDAAENVVKQNEECFPKEAVDDPKNWLINNLSEWWQLKPENLERGEVRFGLLSGFPKDAVLKYKPYHEAMSSIGPTSSLENRMFIFNYCNTDVPRTKENEAKLIVLLKKENATSEQIECIKNARTIPATNTTGGYLGSNGIEDKIFHEEADKLYQQSGIDELANSLGDT